MVAAAEEVVTQATAEGLTLEQSTSALALGATAVEEAALAIARAKARTVGPDTSAGEVSTAEEVVTQATAEGLKLEPSTNSTGYRGVSKDGRFIMPFIAALKVQGKRLHLGNFAIVEEAALAVARAKARADAPSDAATGAFTGRAAPTQSKPPSVAVQTEKSRPVRLRPVRLQLGIWQGRVCAAAHTRHACPAPGCSYVAGHKQNLDRHILGHTGEKPYLCPSPSCNFSCSLDWNLKSHIKGHHQDEQLPAVLASTGATDQRVTPIIRKLKLARGGPRPRHPVVSLKLSVCSDSGLVCALAEVTPCKATVRDADPSWSEDEERERKRTKKGKVPPISHMCV